VAGPCPLLVALITNVLLCANATAATWVVSKDDSGDAATIQAAVDMASPGDTVLVGPGTYTELLTDPFGQVTGVVLTSGIALVAEYGPESTTIDVTDDTQPTRGITCFECDGSTLIEGFRFVGGDNYDGAALWIWGGAPVVRGNVFYDLYGGIGGSVAVKAGSAALIEDNVFDDSFACCGVGGGMLVDTAAPIVRGNLFIRCESALDGGALAFVNAGGEIVGNVFLENVAANGGALLLDHSTPYVAGNVFRWNKARGSGGALALVESDAQLEDNVVVHNRADDDGGGLWLADSSPELFRMTIASNTAGDRGGGVYLHRLSSPDFTGIIISENRGADGVVVSFPVPPPRFMCCDVWGNEGAQYAGFVTDPTGTNGNVSVDPALCPDGQGLQECSPLLDMACGVVGAGAGVQCPCAEPLSIEPSTWARIKSSHRGSRGGDQ